VSSAIVAERPACHATSTIERKGFAKIICIRTGDAILLLYMRKEELWPHQR